MPPHPPRFRSVSRLLLALSLLPGIVPAQAPAPPAAPQPRPPKEETFSESFDVTVVNVEVFVTDREGKRVTGLTRDDFQILEDGKPVAITNFYAADASVVSPGTAGGSAAPPSAPLPEDQRLHLGVLIDTTNLAQKSRAHLEKELDTFLASRLAADDRVLLASYGKEGFKALSFRAGDAALKAAVAEAFTGAPVMSQRLMQLRSLVAQINRSATPGGRLDQAEWELDGARLSDAVASYGKQVVEGARGSVASLDRLLAGMAGLPGRKALLYVSGGLPVQPLAGILEHYQGHFGEDQGAPLDTTLEPLLRQVEERANASRITFYALGDTESVLPGMAFSRLDERDKASLARGLDAMSLPTGGLAELNAADPAGALARMGEDLDSYYSLGYTPPQRKAGESHSIQVKVNRPGLTVRHRQSYRQRSGAETLADRTVSALFFGARENPLQVGVRLQEGEKQKGQQSITLELALPLAKITLVPNGDLQEGKLQIAVAVRDAEGRASNVTVLDLPVRIANAKLQEMQGKTVGYKTKLALRPLEHVVAVGVRDTVGNLDSVVTTTWKPGAAGPAR